MMRSWAGMVGCAGLIVLGGSAACDAQGSAQFGFGLLGGTTTPAGSLTGVAESGWHAGAFLDLTLGVSPVGFRLDGAWHHLGDKHLPGANGSPRVIDGTLDATYALLTQPMIQPYVIGGIGEYSVRSASNPLPPLCGTGVGSNCTVVPTRTGFGFNAGFGVRVSATWFSAFVEARWHDILTGVKNTAMVPITVGLRF